MDRYSLLPVRVENRKSTRRHPPHRSPLHLAISPTRLLSPSFVAVTMNNFSSIHQVPPTPEQQSGTPAADDSFYGTLDLGHATQINNDLVKTIRDEIVDIDTSLQVTSGNVKNEERSFGQLTKDCNHARDEMFSHRRDAAEVLDSEIMTEDIRVGFKDQFATEVAPHVVSPSSNSAHHEHDIESEDENGSAAQQGPSGMRAFSHKKFIERKRAEAKTKVVSIHSIQQEIKTTRKKIKATNDETASYNQDVIARQLDKVKMDGERQVEAKRRECEAENQRNRSVKEAVQVARNNSGAYAQQIAEKAKEQMSERSSNLSKENALASLNTAKQQELDLLAADEKKLDMELAALSSQFEFLSKQVAEFETELKKSIDMKTESEEVQRDIAELTSSKQGKTKEADASNADLQSAITVFEEASKLVSESNAEKLENDKAMVEVLEPAKTRKADAIKEKEKLAGEVVALQKSIEQAQSSNKDTGTNSEAKVITKSNELKEHKAKLEKASIDFQELQKNDAASEAALLSEHNEYKEFATKFEAATKAEMDSLEVQKRERVDIRVKQLEKRRSDLNVLEDKNRSDVENLTRGLHFLQNANDTKKRIEEADLLCENGEEYFLDLDEPENDGMDDASSVNNAEAGSPAVKR